MKKLLLALVAISSIISSYSQLRIKAVGDIMMGSYTPRTVIPENNGQVFVDSIATWLDSADITFGNLEGVFVTKDLEPKKCRPESRKAKRCYEFGMPDTLAYTLKKVNFDVVSLDNNHVSDYGSAGIKHTKQKLSSLGIRFAGKKKPVIYNIDSTSIAVIAFGTSSASWHLSDLKTAKEQIAQLDTLVDIVIVSFHGGAEGLNAQHVYNKKETFYGEDRGNLITFTHAAIDNGADLIIGHGPHVLRGIELYKNKLICYSLGNFLTHGNVSLKDVKALGAILDIQIDNKTGDFMKGKIIPTKQNYPGIPHYDSNKKAIYTIQKLTTEDFPSSLLKINTNGTLTK